MLAQAAFVVAIVWLGLLAGRDYLEEGNNFSLARSLVASLLMFFLWPILWALTPLCWLLVLAAIPCFGLKKLSQLPFWMNILNRLGMGKGGDIPDLSALAQQTRPAPSVKDFPRKKQPL